MPRRTSAAVTQSRSARTLPSSPAGWHSGPLLSPSPGDSSPTLPGSRWPWQRKMALVTRTWVSSVPITRSTRRLRSFRAGCMSRGRSDVLACGAWVLAAGGCGDVDALPAGAGAPAAARAPAAPAQQPGRAARGLCCAEPPLCIFMVPVPERLPLGQGWAGGAGAAPASPRAPGARRVPAFPGSVERRALRSSAARPGCSDAKSLLGEGRGRGWRRGTGAPRLGWEGRREGGGRRGGRLGQDVTSKRRGKLNWARQLHPGGLRPRGALETGVGNSSQGPLSDERMVAGSVGDGCCGILRSRDHKLHRWSLLGDP